MLLPLGSIVYLKEGTAKMMIINRGIFVGKQDKKEMFEYEGCLYPNGANEKNTFYFNGENIDKVVFRGYEDDEEERFQKVFEEWRKDNNVSLVNVDKVREETEKKKAEQNEVESQLFNNNWFFEKE